MDLFSFVQQFDNTQLSSRQTSRNAVIRNDAEDVNKLKFKITFKKYLHFVLHSSPPPPPPPPQSPPSPPQQQQQQQQQQHNNTAIMTVIPSRGDKLHNYSLKSAYIKKNYLTSGRYYKTNTNSFIIFQQCNSLFKLCNYFLLTLRRLMSYIYIYIYIYIYMEHPFLMFLDHTQRRSTVGRTPLDE